VTQGEQDLLYREFSDHRTFCRESLAVETEDKRIVPMELSPGQLRLRAAIEKQRERQRPVRVIYLKARRIQATTATAAEFFHATAFRAGVHTVVMAHDETSVRNIFRIYKRFHDSYKPFAGKIRLPPARPLADRIFYEYGGDPESSFIQIHTSGNANFGRSFRITNVHFSEFPYYQRPGQTLAAVMSAVPKLPDTCAIVEGTAKTIGDEFHRMWQTAVDPASESEWLAIFMAWWEHPSNRMPLTHGRAGRVTLSPDKSAGGADDRVDVERFANSLSREERELQGRFSLDLQQLAWRRFTIHNDCAGDTIRFQREHPATPEEAFTASSRNRFSVPHIQRMPIVRDALAGELEIERVGIEKRLVFLPGERGALRVYRRPERGRAYALGFDCAQGIDVNDGVGQSDPDYSAGQVLDRDTGEQCAVLRARLMPGETGRYMAALGKWFNMAQICGERNPGGGGVSALEALLNADYPAALIYHRSVEPDQHPQVRSDRIGWDTTGVSRPILLSLLDEAIRQGAIHVHDPITQQELLTFVIKANGKPEAQAGCHDDLVIALALAIVVCERMPRPRPDQNARVAPVLVRYGQRPDEDARGRIVRVKGL
jgi:hypothetical protein